MKILRAYWKSILTAMLIIYGCLIRQPHYHWPPIQQGDKWAHLLAFCLLAIILVYDLHKAQQANLRTISFATIAAILLGAAIEILQYLFFYPRTGEWSDWLADCIGIAIGLSIATIWKTIYRHTHLPS